MASKCGLIFALLAVAFIGTARAEFKGLATLASIAPESGCKISKADKADFYLATVPSLFWKDGAACGQCINVAYGKGRDLKEPIKVKIVGECTDCTGNGIELGAKAMAALGGPADAETKFVQWEFVSCVDVNKDTSATGRIAEASTKKKVASRKMLTSEQ